MQPSENNPLALVAHQMAHAVLVILAFWAAYATRFNMPPPVFVPLSADYDYRLDLLLSVVCFHVTLRIYHIYQPHRKAMGLGETLWLFMQITFVSVALTVFSDYALHHWGESRLFLGFFACYAFLFLAIFEYLVFSSRANYLKGHKKNILVIGGRHRAAEFISAVMRNLKHQGYRVVGCLELPAMAETVGDRVYESVKIIGTIDDLETILKTKPIDELVFSMPLKKIANVDEYIFLAESMGINIRILPDFQIHSIRYYPQTASIRLDDFHGLSVMTLSSVPRKEIQLFIKAIIDYTGAAVALFVLCPLLALIALSIKLASPGPVFFSQERCGLNGRIFKMHKFRSMVVDAEKIKAVLEKKNEMDGPVFKIKNDPRVTPVGRFLRTTSLDELPQLFNVLKGEMSLVGPRPPLPTEVKQYKLWQRRRLSMKPGLTCIWQVSGRNDISFERWMEMDLEYIDNWSLKLDFILVLKTIKEMIVGRGR